jgi:hypothetical protein
LNEPSLLAEAITETRDRELSEIRSSLNHLKHLVIKFASSQVDHCISQEFGPLYPDTILACGGCPYCRQTGLPIRPGQVETYYKFRFPTTPRADYLQAGLQAQWGWKPDFPINVFWDDQPNFENIKPKLLDLSELVRIGCQQLILPREVIRDSDWFKELLTNIARMPEIIPHLIIPLEDIIEDPYQYIYPLPSVVVYPVGSETADQLYKALNLRIHEPNFQINIAHRTLRIESLGGNFQDKVNGLSMNLTVLTNSFHTDQDLFSF